MPGRCRASICSHGLRRADRGLPHLCAVELTWLSYVRDSRSPEKSELLRWIVQFPMFVGALQFTLQTMARLARLLRGEPGDDRRLRVGRTSKAS